MSTLVKTVCFVFRKKNPQFFSIEKVFGTIINETAKRNWKTISTDAPWYSNGLFNIFRNIRSLRRNQANIYHITGDIHYAVFAFPRKQTILTIHDSVFIYQTKGFKKWIMLRLFLKWPVRYAKAITTISEKSKEDIVKYGNCDPNKVTVIPDPINNHITFSKKEFNKAQPEILFIGSTPNKNIERTIDALKGIPCRLTIVGRVSELVQEKLKANSIQHHICYNLSEEELNRKYAEADILLFPSLFEGFGLPILEANQAGRPVVTSNMSPMKEVAGDSACLVDPEDINSIRAGMLKVINEEGYRNKLVANGQENLKRFEAGSVVTKYLDLYQNVLASSKGN